MSLSLWSTAEAPRKYFLLSDREKLPPGPLAIFDLFNQCISVEPTSIASFEVTEDQAREWAQGELGRALGEIRGALDEKFTEWRQRLDAFNRSPAAEDSSVAPNTVSALCGLLKELPGVLGKSLSGNEQRVGEARDIMTRLQGQLKDAGIELDNRFTDFPDRLAKLRKDTDQGRASRKRQKKAPESDDAAQTVSDDDQ